MSKVTRAFTALAGLLTANPPGTMHSDMNVGDKPIEVMVGEARDDQ
ncbi:MAG TPA: hypothetical protein VKG01_09090 [Thermoanaerobaculia bacterium]|nr:hypothetical protein [Thermoanaerobaculia bacterium]